jgi:hypothetical protein
VQPAGPAPTAMTGSWVAGFWSFPTSRPGPRFYTGWSWLVSVSVHWSRWSWSLQHDGSDGSKE